MRNRFENVNRARKVTSVSLSDEEREALDKLSRERGKKASRIIGDLLVEAAYGHRAFAPKRRRRAA